MKNEFSKIELEKFGEILKEKNMLNCDCISVYYDIRFGGVWKIDFVKGGKIQTVALGFDNINSKNIEKQLKEKFEV